MKGFKSNITECSSRFCDAFIKEMGYTEPANFYIYHSFVETILDPMMSIRNGTEAFFGYSFTINNNNPNAKEI